MPYYTITKEEAGQKCISFMKRKIAYPLPLLHKLIRNGRVRINGKRCKPCTRIAHGDTIFLPTGGNGGIIQDRDNTCKEAIEQCERSICTYSDDHIHMMRYYEDDDILVLNKPSGIPVHNGTRHTISIATIVHTCYSHLPFAPTLVHRLDKDTTGILLIAKTYSMLNYLHNAWRENSVKKYYLAWVRGIWQEQHVCRIENSIERANDRMIATQGNDVAITVRCLEKAKHSSLLLIQLHTGKTHQIRVQLAYHGFPIVGENKYASNTKKLPFFLHAVALYVTNTIQYVITPQHWYGNFALHHTLPLKAQEFSALLT